MGARAVVVQDGCLLVIRRFKDGQWRAVIPGGKVEPGETPAEAAVRELAEETSLTACVDRLFWDNAADAQLFFLMGPATGTLALGGPEALEQSETNQHIPTWVPLAQLDEIGLVPAALIKKVRALEA
ncbi:NUDIX domain-containing protein [Nakamurella sp. A5-74]|uniref:NUDIX domain-containing protein n=1 Tax=Nakamurella sp. A5-74 TaxID=3158264 RepID=A0AAU8DML4_9ACTN